MQGFVSECGLNKSVAFKLILYSLSLFRSAAVFALYLACFGVHLCTDKFVNAQSVTHGLNHKFSRGRNDNSGQITVLRQEERINLLYSTFPKLFRHSFRIEVGKEAKTYFFKLCRIVFSK